MRRFVRVPVIHKAQVRIMLHCPRNILQNILYSALVFAAGVVPALALDPTGDWRVADDVATIRVAQCNGSMWGAVAWEKTPGGRDIHNPDVSKQNRPTLGMPILIDMKKKPGVDAWEGQVYNAKDGQFYSSTIKPLGSRQSCQQHGQGAAADDGCVAQDRGTEDNRIRQRGSQDAGAKTGDGRAAYRPRRRYLSTPRYCAVCPLAQAGTTAPPRAS
jgi:uncharacterized protein (DUF2147 family)